MTKRRSMVCSAAVLTWTASLLQGAAAVDAMSVLANPLDNHGGGARAMAMGSAFVGVADDSSALLWNPAGLGRLKNSQIAFHHNSWLLGIIQETLVQNFVLGAWGGMAASFNYIDYTSLAGLDINGQAKATGSANRYGLALGWGKEYFRSLALGISAKANLQSIFGDNQSSLSGDLGILWATDSSFRAGAAWTHLGTRGNGYQLDSSLRAGISQQLTLPGGHRLLLAAGASWEPGSLSRVQVGAENVVFSTLALRIGHQFTQSPNDPLFSMRGTTAGLGLLAERYSLDYAYIPYGGLGNAHRISFTYQF